MSEITVFARHQFLRLNGENSREKVQNVCGDSLADVQ